MLTIAKECCAYKQVNVKSFSVGIPRFPGFEGAEYLLQSGTPPATQLDVRQLLDPRKSLKENLSDLVTHASEEPKKHPTSKIIPNMHMND